MILSSDWHTRPSSPRARIDDFLLAQDTKMNFICQEAVKSPPLIIAGDLCHTPRSGPWVEQYLIRLFHHYDLQVIITLGQHDLPGHSLFQIDHSSVGVLEAAIVVQILTKESAPIIVNDWAIWGCAYGEEPDRSMVDVTKNNLLIWHKMVIRDVPLWPGQIADKSSAILRQYSNYQIICSGDNHQSFAIAEVDQISHPDIKPITMPRRWLINPGSLMRMTAAQVDHKPHIYKWEDRTLTPIPIPIEPDVLDLSELEAARDKDGRIQAFVERLSTEWETGLSFEKNIENYFQKNETSKEVQDLVWRCLG